MALEFILKLQDMLTPKLGNSAAAVDKATARMEADMKRLNISGRQMGASFDTVRGKIEQLREIAGRTTDFKIFRDAKREASQLESQLDRLNAKASGKGGGIGGMAGGLLAGAGIAAAYAGVNLVKNSLAQAAARENQQIAFRVLTGNRFAGDALMNNIQSMADRTPYESSSLGRAAKTMLGYGVNQSAIMPRLGQIGDIASAQDDAAGSLESLSLAYGQVAAKGHLAGQEVLQMINAGFNPLKEISIMTGKSMAYLDKMMEKGGITVGMVDKALEHATGTGGKFHDMMKQQSETLGGKWSTFMDLVHSRMRSFGESLAPLAKGMMDFATRLLTTRQSAAEVFQNATNHIKNLRDELTMSNVSESRRKEILAELKGLTGDAVKGIGDEKIALDKLLPSLDAYINKRQMAGPLMKLQEDYAGTLAARATAEAKRDDLTSTLTKDAWKFQTKYNIPVAGIPDDKIADYVYARLDAKYYEGTGRHYGGEQYGLAAKPGSKIDTYAMGFELSALKSTRDKIGMQEAAIIKTNPLYNQYTNVTGRITKYMGVPAAGTPGAAGAGDASAGNGSGAGSDDFSSLKGGAEGAMGGQKTITINIKSFIEHFNSTAITAKEGMKELEPMMREMFLRVVNSVNGEPATY